MEKIFSEWEELIPDERFLSWYFQTDPVKSREWELLLEQVPGLPALHAEAVEWMKQLPPEKEVSARQVVAARQKLLQSLGETTPQHSISKARRLDRKWWMAAAAILVLASVWSLWAVTENRPSVHTSYGETLDRQLPDGSRILLNANSHITYNKELENAAQREVWLKGEAFFHVAKTPTHQRFVVHANGLDIIVTGTRFNVDSRDDSTSVLLTEGSVIIQTANGKTIHLKPGEMVSFAHDQLEKKEAHEETILAWKEHKLIFDNSPIQEVARQIKQHYGVEVALHDEATAAKTVSGILPNNNLDVLLRSLEATGQFSIVKNEDGIIITTSSP